VEQGAAKVDANGSCKGVRRRRNGSGKGVMLVVHGYGEHKAMRRALGERLRRGEASAEWSSGARLSSTWRQGSERAQAREATRQGSAAAGQTRSKASG